MQLPHRRYVERTPGAPRFVRVVLVAALTAAAVLDAARADETAANENSERAYPSIPDALREFPDWMTKNAPFDVADYVRPIPEEENAAPLYLDALYEFYPNEMQDYVSPQEHAKRGPALMKRAARTALLQNREQGTVSADERARDILQYEKPFEKLAEAQKRPHCQFEFDPEAGGIFAHFLAARQVARLINWRVEFWVSKGELDRALDDIERALRLARDLRPHGSPIRQVISMLLDRIITEDLISRVLATPQLDKADCDRLLKILSRHEAEVLDPAEAFRAQYLYIRAILHRLQLKEELGARFGQPGVTNGDLLVNLIAGGEPKADAEAANELDELLERMTPGDFATEADALNRYFRPLVTGRTPRGSEMKAFLERHQRAAGELKVVRNCLAWVPEFVNAARRDRIWVGAAKCLAGLARWKLEHAEELPPDLAAVCEAARMKSVPIDEYSETDEPLRGIRLGEEFVIYTVWLDGEDNEAQLIWQPGQSNGDWVFRLKPVKK